MTMHRVTHDGVEFACRIEGKEGAPWMVFSNSLATNLTVWDQQVAAFAGRYRVLRYDQRGHGGTSVPEAAASIPQLAGDAAALMAHFGVVDAVFVGVSMGAATGLCLAGQGGGRIARLVAADGQAATAAGGAAAWAERMAFARAKGMAAFAELTIPRWFAAASREAGHAAIPLVRAMIAGTAVDGLCACAAALQDYDVRAGLPGIAIPVLLIAGSEDGVMPATMQALAPQIAGGAVCRNRGCRASCRASSGRRRSMRRWRRFWRERRGHDLRVFCAGRVAA